MRIPAILSLTLFAAGAAAQEARPTVEELFPLEIGNTWTYKVSGQDDRFVIRAVRREMVGSQTCVLLEASLRNRVVATEHVAFTNDGLCRFRVDKVDVSPPVCVLRSGTPAKGAPVKGWWDERNFKVGDRTASWAFWTTKGETQVQVPAGTFKTVTVHAAEYRERAGAPRVPMTSVWYSPAVGMVKQTVVEGKGRGWVLELEKFETAKE